MPIYEYECRDCGNEWDELQKISEGPKRKCPSCGAFKAKRLISQSSFVLKGAGWYVTDYGKGSGGRAGEKKSPPKKEASESKPKSESSSKTSKPAKKSD